METAPPGAPPVWFLDIDGVVNAFPSWVTPHRADYERTEVAVSDGEIFGVFPIQYRPSVVEFVNRAHREGLAEVRWLTTWGRHARQAFAPAVGFDAFDVAADPPSAGGAFRSIYSRDWWKLGAIREAIGSSGHRFVFTDDDLSRETSEVLAGWFGEEQMLLVAPAPRVGLADGEIERIAAFLQVTSP
ncbi:MAG: HAD domain-containing protein [Promicromonosporaceae bacterium]|nr:HAD domain-containing protein [Promicromonosporaceae bacterium]